MSDKPRVKWNGEKYVAMQAMSLMSAESWEQAAADSRKQLIEQRRVKMSYERGELFVIPKSHTADEAVEEA